MPRNPSPKSKKLSGNTSARTTARRGSRSEPSARMTRMPSTAMPKVRPLAAHEYAK
jgi:hypothetical protein